MALDQSALLDLLAQLKLTDVTDRIRVATEQNDGARKSLDWDTPAESLKALLGAS